MSLFLEPTAIIFQLRELSRQHPSQRQHTVGESETHFAETNRRSRCMYLVDSILRQYFKVSKGAKNRNRYNQVPHLTPDTRHKGYPGTGLMEGDCTHNPED